MQNKRRTNYRRQQTKQSKDDHAIPIKVLLCKNYVFSVKKSNIWYFQTCRTGIQFTLDLGRFL